MTVVILSIVTCGIYAIIWYWNAINELYKAGGKSVGNLEPLVQFLLFFVYVGGIFFAINANDNLNAVRVQKGQAEVDNKVLYIVLALLCPIIMVYLVQDEMNKLA
ncbi:MAG: DUF4234 domain-containing protein [Oscillospiraceae bacterium]|nr:DUF4234 domain-containing protein [Oscillospiraceae bacterium]